MEFKNQPSRGLTTFPTKSMVPLNSSLIRNKKGWSATKSIGGGGGGLYREHPHNTLTVTAAAFVPSSFTSYV
ncbi:hypothetical protein MTR_7g050815 [Medicago truncatula]|uniref:Uncharacterized protein n=1 Tax=Medicago truncatula TaxID=3880 RepID=A0A072TYL2_MEDTR|nr:hypothetical protein MTR_7g050815 [Medicago truncatula]